MGCRRAQLDNAAARDLASPRPALLAAIIYEFSSSMESFEAPLVVGLPGNVYVYSTMIYISTREPLANYGLGATFAASYVLMAVAFAYFYQRAILLQSERFATVTGKGFGRESWRSAVGAISPWVVLWLFFRRRCAAARRAHLDFSVAVLPAAFYGSARASELE